MKKIIYTVLIAMSSFWISCSDYLDTDKYFNDTLLFDSIWVNKRYTEGWLANTYFSMWEIPSQRDIRKMYAGPMFSADDLIYGDWLDRNYRCEVFQYGTYGPSNQVDNDPWGRQYQTIRRASIFIQNVDKCEEMSSKERQDAKAQARFVRAYVYYKLIEKYGPVPILPDEGLDVEASYEELATSRNTMDQCTDYVCAQLEQAAGVLPTSRVKGEIMRPTKGASLAIRAKMLNLAASPLYNSEQTPLYSLVNYEGEKLVENTYKEEKWARAAAAAKEVIDLSNELGLYKIYTMKSTTATIAPPNLTGYSDVSFGNGGWNENMGWEDIDPYRSYAQLFDGTVPPSQIEEIIWVNDNRHNINELIEHVIPRGQQGWNTIAVTQKQVDAYQMCDGKDIAHSSSSYPYKEDGFYDPSDPSQVKSGYVQNDVSLRYVNREPRFYASIGYNGTIWGGLSITQDGEAHHNHRATYYKGGADGKNLSEIGFHPYTGYTMYKYYHQDDAMKYDGSMIADKFEIIIRYAEVLLWYAEAMNHLTTEHSIPSYTQEGEVKVSRNVDDMKACIRPIRVRAGLPDYESNIYGSEAAFTTALKHERQIEFFGEAKRYYDLNRWLDAMTEQNQAIMGCNMEMRNTEGQKQRFYDPVVISSMPKAFVERQYLWPLPTNELKRNGKLTQNPGWK